MLTKFRKGADNIFVRILLGLIALSFVGFGASSFLSGNSRGNVITFSKAPSISTETFLVLKAKEIEYIQQQNGINLTEEQINALNIDKGILQRIINDAMISYLASLYNFEISDEIVIKFVKKMPYFKDQKGNFDLKLFKSSFRNSQRQEDEFLENVKTNLIKSAVIDIFMEPFKPSKLMVNNMINYMAETKYFDIISIDLTHKITDFRNDQINNKEIEEYYKKNENDFTLPELRSFNYMVFDQSFFSKKIKIEEEEIHNYYNENKTEFGDKPYLTVKKEVEKSLFNSKLEELIADLAKNLEDDVAAGINLANFAIKYNMKISTVNDISKEALKNNKKLNLAATADSIFEMLENEVSYPLELPEQKQIALVELKNITPPKKQEFEEVKDKIYAILRDKITIATNIKILEDIQKTFIAGGVNLKSLKEDKRFIIENNKSLARIDLQNEEKINPELAYLIFNAKKNQITKIVRDNNKAYFAFIKDENINNVKAKKFEDTSLPSIVKAIKEGVMQELIGHLTEKNDMKVKL